MSHLSALLHRRVDVFGVFECPVWVLFVLAVVGTVNEYILRSKWTEAKSLWQSPFRFLLWVPGFGMRINKVPLLGWFLRRCAGLDEQGREVVGEIVEKKAVAEPPPPPREGGFANSTLVVLLVLGFLGVVVSAFAGCACKAGVENTPACARQGLTLISSVNGFAARFGAKYIKSCNEDGEKLKAEGKIDEAEKRFAGCRAFGNEYSRGLHGTYDSTAVAGDAVDVGEKAGAKDYSGMVAPAKKAACDVIALLKNQKVELPAYVIQAVNQVGCGGA